jgi:hypothetical protein
MKPTTRLVLCAAAMYAVSAPAAAQDANKGAALLLEARRALGGEEKLRAIRALDVRGDFKRAAGQITLAGELQVRLELPDKLRRDEDLNLPGGGVAVARTEVLNGSTVWEDGSGGTLIGRLGRGARGAGGPRGGPAAIDPAQVEEAQRRARQIELSRFLLAWLLTVDGEASWIATAESPDGKADVIEITPANGPVTRLFLDQTTHLPLMVSWQGVAPQLLARARGAQGSGTPTQAPPPQRPQQQATLQMTLADYKTVDGVKLPHLMTRGVNDMTIEEWTIDRYDVNPSFKSDVFTK